MTALLSFNSENSSVFQQRCKKSGPFSHVTMIPMCKKVWFCLGGGDILSKPKTLFHLECEFVGESFNHWVIDPSSFRFSKMAWG